MGCCLKPFVAVLVLALALSGCAAHVDSFSFSGSRSDAPMRAIGYATVSIQPGRSTAQKQLNAIRAAKLAAMRELAEKLYGANVAGQASVAEGRIVNDLLRSEVEGLIRGARVVSIQPVRNDVYQAELEIAADEVYALRSRGRPVFQ